MPEALGVRLAGSWASAIVVAALTLLSGCGVASPGDESTPAQTSSARPSDTAAPTLEPPLPTPGTGPTGTEPPLGDRLARYYKRCLEATQDTEGAELEYDDQPQMRLNHEELYRVVVRPRSASAPTQSQGSTVTVPVEVTCTISARLKIEDADVTPADWEERVFEPPASVEWSWEVIPRRAGELVGEIELRPIAVVDIGGNVERRDLTTVPFDVTVDVDESVWDRLQRVTTRIDAIRLFVLAVGGLVAALGVTRWFQRRRTTDVPGRGNGADGGSG